MQTNNVFTFCPFSKKQRQLLNWWTDASPVKDSFGIIADGSIRSGKSLAMSLSFVLWAMTTFNGQSFGMCGKTVGSFRRNVLCWLKVMLAGRGYVVKDKLSENRVIISSGAVENDFYIFGGKDERSQDLIQGVTLAGVLLDEVALMPESFVSQATARCSVKGSKLWFNCNPSYPSHWFKTDWIDCAKDKGLLYLHFTMEDNLSLAEDIKERYRNMYTGVFYERFILGLWVLAQGVIYPMYKESIGKPPEKVKPSQYVISIDYGTQNAFAALLWAKYGNVWYAVREYYYSGRNEGISKTDGEYLEDLNKWREDIKGCLYTIIDPSAASFITLLRRNGTKYRVKKADNDVLDGIRDTATSLKNGYIRIMPDLKNFDMEINGYVWDESEIEDRPIKVNDHLMDAMRYFVRTAKIAKGKADYQLSWT